MSHDASMAVAEPAVLSAGSLPPATGSRAVELSVVIVSYNTRAMTLDCLRALYADLEGASCEVFVVDNASTDGSPDAIRSAFPGVHLIENPTNVGFGAANNQAFDRLAGEFVMLLNTDAFPLLGATRTLRRYLEEHPSVGVVGPKLLNADGSVQQSCFRFPSPGQAWRENLWISILLRNHPDYGDYRFWRHDAERDVEWVVGACLIVRRGVLRAVGGFDPRFFMYAEETDWQRRIRDAGWGAALCPAAKVTHLGGASGARESARVRRHFFDSLDLYQRKHHGTGGLLSLRAAMVIGCSLRGMLWCVALVLRPWRWREAVRKVERNAWLVARQIGLWRQRSDVGSQPVLYDEAFTASPVGSSS